MGQQEWFEGLRRYQEASRKGASRLSDEIQFVYGLGEADWPPEPYQQEDFERIGAKLVAEVGLDLPEGVPVRFAPADTGRGADAIGILIQIYDAAKDLATDVATWVGFGAIVRAAWRRLIRKKGAPALSLGALKILCAMDLAERIGKLEGVQLAYAGDVGPGMMADLSFTGGDVFFILFARDGETWVYLVDGIGQLIHFGIGRQHRTRYTLQILGSQEFAFDPSGPLPPMLLSAQEEQLEEEAGPGP